MEIAPPLSPLGQLYLSGTTLPRDPAAAVRWLERAALGGDQHAQYRLGKLLLQGEEVPKDADGAVRWLTASAEQGSRYAQYALGKLFLLGKDVPEDRKAARQWFQKAAEQGDQYAQYLWSVWITGIFFPLCSQPPGCSITWPASSGSRASLPTPDV